MLRCPTCGRLLAGLRHDHPVLCRVRDALLRGGAPLEAPRIRILEGSGDDPLALPEPFVVRAAFTGRTTAAA